MLRVTRREPTLLSRSWTRNGSSCTTRHSFAPTFPARPGSSNCSTDPSGLTFFKTEIGVTPITNLEVAFKAMDKLSVTVGAANVFDRYPNKRNALFRAAQFGSGDNGAVAGYPSFSPFGINGAYYYGKLDFRF